MLRKIKKLFSHTLGAFTGFLALTLPQIVYAADGLDKGDTGLMLTSSLLVLLMALPGLALFYGGLVRS